MNKLQTSLRILTAPLLALALPACSPLGLVNSMVPEDNHRVEPGLAYGPGARQRLDVYRPPAGEVSKGTVVFFYGGSWKRGARQSYRFVGEAFAGRGYTVVIPDYRLYPEVRFPGFVEDGALAVAWVRRNIDKGGSKPLVLMGHSAGAQIAALLALDPSYLAARGVPEGRVDGWVGLAGPYAFDPLRYRTIRPIFEGEAPVERARAINFARGDAPPSLLIHGLDDTTVRPRNSEELASRLTDRGAEAEYLPLERIGHVWVLLALAEPFEDHAPVVESTLSFMEGLPNHGA
ncbi:MAG: alpha/beta hydrolase [Kiloniellales bacterium]|nr:alpha/beta hydrolase [Kiloniellales bacterium]MDJ0982538.1 alpha/beta hydrolase [Kiloniellales bacterium]